MSPNRVTATDLSLIYVFFTNANTDLISSDVLLFDVYDHSLVFFYFQHKILKLLFQRAPYPHTRTPYTGNISSRREQL